MAPESTSFPRGWRLTKRDAIRAVDLQGKRHRTRHLEVRALASLFHHPRVGFIVPRYKRSAVERNRLKRRLREIVRLHMLRAIPPVDVVVRARPAAYEAPYGTLRDELLTVREQLERVVR